MRVILITPPYDKRRFRVGESLGLKYLATVLDQKVTSAVVLEPTLMGWGVTETVEEIQRLGCDVLGISLQFSHGLYNAVKVIERIKKDLNPHITMGGHFASFHYDELLAAIPQLDSIVMFEGEETVCQLVEMLEKKSDWDNISGLAYRGRNGLVVRTKSRPLIRNLNDLPFPRRDGTSRLGGEAHYGMISSRGCLFCCTFCSVPFFYDTPGGPRWRVRSPGNVVDEMEYLVKLHGAEEISFFDDNFLGSNKIGEKRAIQIANEIVSRGLAVKWSIESRTDDINSSLLSVLKTAGLRHINLGIESGDQRVLDRLRKLTKVSGNLAAIEEVRDLGLSAYYHFIMFNADTTVEEIEASLDFIRVAGIGNFSVISNRLDVYRGTPEFNRLQQEGRIRKQGYEYSFKFRDGTVEMIYQAIHRSLRGLFRVELAIQQKGFALDTGIQIETVRNHFLMPSSSQDQPLNDLQNELSDRTCDFAASIVSFLKHHPKVTKSVFDSLTYSIRIECEAFSAQMLDKIIPVPNEDSEL